MPTKKKKKTQGPAVASEVVAKHVSTACSVEFGRDAKIQERLSDDDE